MKVRAPSRKNDRRSLVDWPLLYPKRPLKGYNLLSCLHVDYVQAFFYSYFLLIPINRPLYVNLYHKICVDKSKEATHLSFCSKTGKITSYIDQ